MQPLMTLERMMGANQRKPQYHRLRLCLCFDRFLARLSSSSPLTLMSLLVAGSLTGLLLLLRRRFSDFECLLFLVLELFFLAFLLFFSSLRSFMARCSRDSLESALGTVRAPE